MKSGSDNVVTAEVDERQEGVAEAEKRLDAAVPSLAGARPKHRRTQWAEVWRRLRRNWMAMLGLAIIVIIILTAIFADFIAPYDYREQDLMSVAQPPSSEHLLGTDDLGRDILSRIIHGARVSLQVGFVAVSISLIIGGTLGALAGCSGIVAAVVHHPGEEDHLDTGERPGGRLLGRGNTGDL
ncbi:MAG: ABC transporter permease, partial [Spirochaetota bacterium]